MFGIVVVCKHGPNSLHPPIPTPFTAYPCCVLALRGSCPTFLLFFFSHMTWFGRCDVTSGLNRTCAVWPFHFVAPLLGGLSQEKDERPLGQSRQPAASGGRMMIDPSTL